MPANNSEVAVLMATIDAEYGAARAALYDPALGTARHEFISARMERAQVAGQSLIETLGKEAALPLIIAAMSGE